MGWSEAFRQLGVRVASRDGLLAVGATARGLTAAVRAEHLVRARRDHYVLPETSQRISEAVRVGGRLACLSALAEAGLFAIDAKPSHIHLDPHASRIRHPLTRSAGFRARPATGAVAHWLPLIDPEHANEYSVGLLDALAQVARCQHPWHALASIDSALHAGLLTQAELREAFSRLPLRCRDLVELADGRAEAGQETVLRMIARSAGLQFELQVQIAELGRVDLLIEGCLVVEADSRLAHDGWDLHVRDRWRDLIAARHGYMSLRPAYQHTMWTPNLVRDAIVHLLDANRHFRRCV